MIKKDSMFYRFSAYGFLKNLRFFEPFILLIFRDNGLSYLQIGALYSIRDIANNILEIPTGVFADAFGRRKAMVLAFTSYIASLSLFFIFREFYAYMIAMIFFAFGEAFRSGTHKALILEYLKLNNMLDVKVAYYGRTRGASQLGSAFNSIIAAALLFYTGDYRFMFIATTIPYILDLINLATYPKELDGELPPIKSGMIVTQMKMTIKDFSGIFTNRFTMKAILNSASFSALFKSSKDYLQPILESFALGLPFLLLIDDVKRSGVVIGLVYFCIYLLTSYSSRNSDRLSVKFRSLSIPINLTYLFGMGLIIVAGFSTWKGLGILSILIFLMFYVLQNLRKPMSVAFLSDQISQKVMASGLSVETQFTTIIAALVAPLLGFLADSYSIGFALAILGLAFLILFFFVRVEDNPQVV